MEPNLSDVKSAIESGNRLFEEFKSTVETQIAEIKAKGVADPLLQQKLDKLNAAMDQHSALNEKLIETRAIVDRLAAEGAGVLVISSELDELMGTCDRIAVMSRGELVATYDRAQFEEAPIIASAFREPVAGEAA